MKYFSTFSGIGGFELGIKKAYEIQNLSSPSKFKHDSENTTSVEQGGMDINQSIRLGDIKCVGYSEVDKYAKQIYRKHFNHKNYGDITKINAKDLPEFELLVGGFPCQSFSIAGKRGGFSDTRGTLFFDLARLAQQRKPRLLLFENVKGLLSHDKGQTFRTVIRTLDELGYDLQWQVLNSKYHGVPQNRERVFIVGHLRGTPRPEVFPIGKNDQISNRENEPRKGSSQTQHSTTVREGMGSKADSTFIADYRNDEGLRVRKEEISPCLAKRKHSETDISTMPPLRIDKADIRRLTPTECERLQGFEGGWTKTGIDENGNEVDISDTQRYKVLGNAVTVNVIKDIVLKLLETKK